MFSNLLRNSVSRSHVRTFVSRTAPKMAGVAKQVSLLAGATIDIFQTIPFFFGGFVGYPPTTPFSIWVPIDVHPCLLLVISILSININQLLTNNQSSFLFLLLLFKNYIVFVFILFFDLIFRSFLSGLFSILCYI